MASALLVQPGTARARAAWRSCLSSSLRTTLACAIVACAKYYGPAALRRSLALPALSYTTAIIIAMDVTLGSALHGAACALYATLQTAVPAVLVLWALSPRLFSVYGTALAVALSSFLVSLPASTHVTAKRIALLQIVTVYVPTFILGPNTDPVMGPVHVAASSGFGALAAVAAAILPLPRLARREVRKKKKLFTGTISERLKLYVNAICAENRGSADASVSQTKCLTKASNKLLQRINLEKVSTRWESPLLGCGSSPALLLSQKLQALEMPLKGMEMALASCPSFPTKLADPELKAHLMVLSNDIPRLLELEVHFHNKDSCTVPEAQKEEEDKLIQSIQIPFPTINDLPAFFFLYCMKLLRDESAASQTLQAVQPIKDPFLDSSKQEPVLDHRKNPCKEWVKMNCKRITEAFKCSLTMGLAVLFGMLFSKDNSYWGGLLIAAGIAPCREATYGVANVRIQGTVLGSIYGLLGSIISERLLGVRFMILLPWFIFSNFLRRSRMYGPAGGISAALAAILVLARKDYGSPSEFVLIRITETVIALSCSIFVEILLQPTRASSLAKLHLSEGFMILQRCLKSMAIQENPNISLNRFSGIKQNLKLLKENVDRLSKVINEATLEPNFWFRPFPAPCYNRMLVSLSKMTELLQFGLLSMEFIEQESQRLESHLEEIQPKLNEDVGNFLTMVHHSIKCFEQVIRIRSLDKLEKELERKNGADDIEVGKIRDASSYKDLCVSDTEKENAIGSVLECSMEAISRSSVATELKTQVVLRLSTIGFCMDGLVKETRELEKGVKELVQWENPSSHVNLYEICSKINELYS